MHMNEDRADDTLYHEGEQALQSRVGVREKMAKIGRRMIRDFMPDEHREFFAQLSWLLVGSLDAVGRPWASVLTGNPGFIASPDPKTLIVRCVPRDGDVLAANLRQAAPIGLLGIEPQTRRRNRMNGTVNRLGSGEIEIRVDQSFGNCPKYINRKSFERRGADDSKGAPLVTDRLTPRGREIVATADTLFIASAFLPPADRNRSHGVDVSHRGGKPGFVRIETDGLLTIPDYVGNFAFNTLGNIDKDRRCGLLFIHPDGGDVLQLTARAEIDWNSPEIQTVAGVQRLLRVQPTEMRLLPASFPLRATTIDYSPNLADIESLVAVSKRTSLDDFG
jgi:predicted pyridoxine 5'-phosphate oxidase superfamily flavin-nucleotide-binding protein